MDIVDKLRLFPASTTIPIEVKPRWNLMVGAIAKEGADTIESLRQQAILRDLEIARLREALEEVADSGILSGSFVLHDKMTAVVNNALYTPIDATKGERK